MAEVGLEYNVGAGIVRYPERIRVVLTHSQHLLNHRHLLAHYPLLLDQALHLMIAHHRPIVVLVVLLLLLLVHLLRMEAASDACSVPEGVPVLVVRVATEAKLNHSRTAIARFLSG